MHRIVHRHRVHVSALSIEQITGKKVSLFNRPLMAPAALDEVATAAETLAVNQQPLLLSKLSARMSLTTVRSGELLKSQPSDPVNIQRTRL